MKYHEKNRFSAKLTDTYYYFLIKYILKKMSWKEFVRIINLIFQINPFVSNALFLYPLKASKNLTVFCCFQGLEKWGIGNKWVKSKILSNFFCHAVKQYLKINPKSEGSKPLIKETFFKIIREEMDGKKVAN